MEKQATRGGLTMKALKKLVAKIKAYDAQLQAEARAKALAAEL